MFWDSYIWGMFPYGRLSQVLWSIFSKVTSISFKAFFPDRPSQKNAKKIMLELHHMKYFYFLIFFFPLAYQQCECQFNWAFKYTVKWGTSLAASIKMVKTESLRPMYEQQGTLSTSNTTVYTLCIDRFWNHKHNHNFVLAIIHNHFKINFNWAFTVYQVSCP